MEPEVAISGLPHLLQRQVEPGEHLTEGKKLWRYGSFDDIWGFPKIGVPQARWFTMENPIEYG